MHPFNRPRLVLYSAIIIGLLFLTMMTSELSKVKAIPIRDSDVVTIQGQVIDTVTGQPIEDATVTVWEVTMTRRTTYTTLKEVTKTTNNGYYSISVEDEILCRVYAYYDDPASPGYDYLPKLSTLNLKKGEEVNLLFDLMPAASIILEGALLFVDSPRPPETVGFLVSPEEKLPGTGGNIFTYGTIPEAHNQFIDENASLIIVPANTSFHIKIEASTPTYHMFIMNNLIFPSLSKGEAIRVRVAQYSLPYNLNLTRDSIRLAETHLNETEQMGFYVRAERRDLGEIMILVENVAEKLIGGFYEETYTQMGQRRKAIVLRLIFSRFASDLLFFSIINISGCHIIQRFVIALVVVVVDEIGNRFSQLRGAVVMLQLDDILQ